MACSKSLRTDLLPTAPGGGLWTYVGYNVSNPAGPWNGVPAVPLVATTPGAQYGTGDNPTVMTEGKTPGFYKFTYTLGGAGPCPDTADLIIEIQALECAGADVAVTYCSNDAVSKDLYTLINTGSPCGTATVGDITNPTAPGGPNTTVYTASSPTTLTLVPASNAAGVHVLVNSVDTDPSMGFTQVPCGCTDSSTLTITIIDAVAAGTISPDNIELCSNGGCTIDFGALVTGEGTSTGEWRFTGSSPSGSANLSVNGGATTNYAPNSVLTTNLNSTVNFQNVIPGRTYNFSWSVNVGTPCQLSDSLVVTVTPNSAGTAPAWNSSACLGEMITLTGDTFALWDVLGGSPSTTGNWTVTSSNPNVRTLNALNTGVAGNGTDDEFTWSGLEGFVTGQWVPLPTNFDTILTFTYTPTAPGECSVCAGAPVSWQIYIIGGVEAGTGSSQTICGGTYDPFDWLTGAQVGNYWQAISTIPGLENINSAQIGFTAGQNISSQNDPLTDRSRPALDWDNVPAGTYTIRYRSAAGACFDFSDVIVTVAAPLTITVQPVGGTTCEGVDFEMCVTVTGGAPPITYLWEFSSDGVNYSTPSNGGGFQGQGTSCLTYDGPVDPAYFRVTVDSACGDPVTSDVVFVDVIGSVPTISDQPDGATICSGGTHTMNVASPQVGVIYQWQSSANGVSFNDIIGATSSSYTTPALNSTTYYRVLVAAQEGCPEATSATATVTVVQDPTVTVQPVGGTICDGDDYTLSVTASGGTPSLTYQWQSSPDGIVWSNVVGATSNSYTALNLLTSTYYRVIVSASGTGCGSVTSNSALVSVVDGCLYFATEYASSIDDLSALVTNIVVAGGTNLNATPGFNFPYNFVNVGERNDFVADMNAWLTANSDCNCVETTASFNNTTKQVTVAVWSSVVFNTLHTDDQGTPLSEPFTSDCGYYKDC